MDKELTYKKIDNCFEVRKNLWTTVIILSGGISGVILTGFSFTLIGVIKIILIILGIILDYFFIMSIVSANKELHEYFKLIETEKQK